MSTIYVVVGSTGEYSDRTEWMVRAYRDEEEAQAHVVNADRRAKEIEQWTEVNSKIIGYWCKSFFDDAMETIPEMFNQYDPHMRMYYTGTYYHLEEVELEE